MLICLVFLLHSRKNDLDSLNRLNQLLIQHNIFTTFDPNLRPALWPSQEEMVKTTNKIAMIEVNPEVNPNNWSNFRSMSNHNNMVRHIFVHNYFSFHLVFAMNLIV